MTFISLQVPDVCLIFSLFPSFSEPASPRNLRVAFSNQSQITLKWDAPDNAAAGVNYSVKLSSRFWGHYFSENVKNLNHTFDALKSGSRYEAEVQTVVGNTSSSVERLCPYTGEAFFIRLAKTYSTLEKRPIGASKETAACRVWEAAVQKAFPSCVLEKKKNPIQKTNDEQLISNTAQEAQADKKMHLCLLALLHFVSNRSFIHSLDTFSDRFHPVKHEETHLQRPAASRAALYCTICLCRLSPVATKRKKWMIETIPRQNSCNW